jgi:signal transduction histidine kinase/ligand-binding sensor domain-containing protein
MLKNKVLYFFSIISLLFASSLSLNGQKKDLYFERIKGVGNPLINKIIQDSEGFLWIGSWGGLCKFDGYKFKEYKFFENDTNSISAPGVLDIAEDQQGRLWVGCNFGLCIYNKGTDNFTRFFANANDHFSLIGSDLTVIHVDKKNRLWIGTHREGLCMLKIDSNADYSKTKPLFKYFPYDAINQSGISGPYIYSIFEDSQGKIWISANNRIVDRYNEDYGIFEHFSINNYKIYKKTDFVALQCEESEGKFWFATQGSGIFSWNTNENTIKQYINIAGKNSLSFDYVRHIRKANDSLLWIATEGGGISYLYTKKQTFQYSLSETGYAKSLSSNSVYYTMEDRSGVTWVGTYNGGLNKLDKYKTFFKAIQPDPLNKNSLNHKSVLTVLEDKDGNLWIGTDGGGLNYLDKKTGKYSYYKYNPDDPNSISSNAVVCIIEDYQRDLWLGTYGGGLNYFNKKTKKFSRYLNDRNNPYSLSQNNVWVIQEDHNHNIWVVTILGTLNIFNRQTQQFYRYYSNASDPDNYVEYYPTQMYLDSRNYMWIATSNGLQMADLNRVNLSVPAPKLKFLHFYRNTGEYSINSNSVYSIAEGFDGNMWFGTDEGWINKLDIQTMKFSAFTDSNGLRNNGIRALEFDNDSNLWIGTLSGLWYFDHKTKKFRSYNLSDGLLDMNFARGRAKLSDGTLMFCSANGINAFNPKNLPYNKTRPPVVITEIKVFNKPVKIGEKVEGVDILKKPISETEELVLPHNINLFSIEFSALDYTIPEKNKYAYKLIGFDKYWNYTGAQNRVVTYTNLDPGKYIFMVKGSNNDNVWNEFGRSLVIKILPPWWGTWWFRILAVLTLVGGIVLYFRLKTELYRKRQEQLTSLVEKRTEELLLSNQKLLEHKMRLEEQSQELQAQRENLLMTNNLLIEKQDFILEQSKKLEHSNEQLSVLNATKDKFFSIIAHDLRNPFNVLMGLSEIMFKNYNKLSPDKIQKYSEIIYLSAKSGYNLLENLLQWSRSQTGNIAFDPTKVQLQVIAEETVALLEASAERKNVTIQQNIGPDVVAFADESMVMAIFRNLVSNAIKFCNENGTVKISAYLGGNGSIEVSVSDNGVGISKDIIDRLFRIDSTISTKGTFNETGTGLGLLLCKEFVGKHNSKIWVISEENKGSDFRFTLPIGQKK